jgi:hypothetical protein
MTNLYPPREGDMSREEAAALADKAIADFGGPEKAQVFFKFTCQWCGARCTFNDPNTLWENGECAQCGQTMSVQYAGFCLHFKTR